ncbi:toxin-antitoxin system YwqK family antitoxin [Flavobacterium algicola]|uniref:toxin-antitoxin system YwqK family antitoxin n=1 Tax=Flavobacterium algicola TaxID=556529 RepID=UPI001EFDFE8F|nr:hypothetical protein [Flavobacterium algicola]MCG9793252.1 hypothetical protein [Flavobacterium algicola]
MFSFLLLFSCREKNDSDIALNQVFDYSIDTTKIPKDTIEFDNSKVSLVNGIYYYGNKKYSGILHKVLRGYNVQSYSSLLNGELHGIYRSFYQNGQPYEVRRYKNSLSVGKQYGYWPDNGKLKFEYNYYNEKREGVQKSWYYDGSKSYVYNYKDDKQVGLQQAWRSNATLYRNFVVKDGKRYGLQSSFTCYEINKGKVKRSKY